MEENRMHNKPSRLFVYTDKTSNIFLFYQSLTEKLFDFSPDSYKITTHNTHTLILEAYNTFLFLKQDNSVERFFDQYMEDIIEEILFSIRNDIIAKRLFGGRLEKYVSLLEQTKNDSTPQNRINIFESNIRNIINQFGNKAYYHGIVEQLIADISGSKNNKKLLN